MKKFLPFSRRQPSLDRYTVNKGGWSGSERINGKSMRRISAISLNTRSIQVVRGAYNIDLNKVDSSFTKLHRACLLNDDAQVRKHLNKVPNNSHDSSNRYPIHLATVNGNFAIVKLLIENQADPNVQDNEENTPLMKSIECGHEHLVKYLLQNGADPNISDSDNNTALHWAVMTESTIAIDALLCSKKCDLSLKNNKDETCLHLAVRSPIINMLTFESMVRAGADLEAKDQLGLTVLDIAQACNNKTALSAFYNCRDIYPDNHILNHKTSETKNNNADADDQQTGAKKLCEEYKLKYIAKNQENLEYERKTIQLNAQIERLKLDMGYLKEQNDKINEENENLRVENSSLKKENNDLVEQLKINANQKENEPLPIPKDLEGKETNLDGCNKDLELEKLNSIECRGHENFMVTKVFLQERINKLKYGLNSVQ